MAGQSLIGNLAVLLSLDTAAFEDGASHASKLMKKTQRDIESIGTKISAAGARFSIALTAPFAGLIATAIPAARESREAIGQVNAALASMGPVAGKTSDELKELAAQLQKTSTFDDDDILKSVTANLLTFGNVSGDVFDRAQQAAVNLSARLGQDLQSSAIQVGKALNDPIKGVTALQRVGVSFTEQQKEQIKAMVETGHAADAQRLILGELEKQFGGSAQALRDATPGADTTDAWRDFQETIGEIALKVLPKLTEVLTSLLNAFNSLSPGMQNFVVGAAAVGAALGPILLVVGPLVGLFGKMLPAIVGLSGPLATAAAGTGLLAGAMTALRAAMAFLTGPWGIAIAAIATAVGVLYLRTKDATEGQAALAKVMAADKSGALAKGTDALALSRAGLTRETLKAALAEAKLQAQQARTALDLAKRGVRVVDNGRGGKQEVPLDTFRGRGGSELSQARTAAIAQARDAANALNAVANGYRSLGQVAATATKPVKDVAAALGDTTSKGAGASKTADDFKDRLQSLLDRLNPVAAATRDFQNDAAMLEEAQRRGVITTDEHNAAFDNLVTTFKPVSDGLDDVELGITSLGDAWDSTMDKLTDTSGFNQVKSGLDKQLGVDDLRNSMDRIREVAPDAFDVLARGTEDAILGFSSLGDAIRNVVAQLASMAWQSFIFDPLKASLFGGSNGAMTPGSVSGGGGFLGTLLGLGKSLVGAFGGGGGLGGLDVSAGLKTAGATNLFGSIPITDLTNLLPGRAMGGSVVPRSAYMVGERGPELFVPHSAGTIVANDELGGRGSVTIHAPMSFPGITNVRDARESARQGAAELQRKLGTAARQGYTG